MNPVGRFSARTTLRPLLSGLRAAPDVGGRAQHGAINESVKKGWVERFPGKCFRI